MAFVAILAIPGEENLHISASNEPVRVSQPLTAIGTFGDRPLIVVFQREIPDAPALLERVGQMLASSRVKDSSDAYSCPAPLAIRAIELAVAEMWPPNRLRCSECQQHFVTAIAESGRMYVACPHCHNPMLNPRWHAA